MMRDERRMRYSPVILIVMLLAAVCFVESAAAQTIIVKGVKYKVRIKSIRDGKLVYESVAGERSVYLESIEAVRLEKYPQLDAGDKAFEAKDYATAAAQYEKVYTDATESEKYLKIIYGAKLVVALERANKISEAYARFASLVQVSQSELVKLAAPTKKPATEAQQAQVAKQIEDEAAAVGDATVRAMLKSLARRARGLAPPKNDPLKSKLRGAGVLIRSAEANQDQILKMISEGKAADALKKVNADLQSGVGSQSKLLLQKGYCLAALKQHKDAAIAYLRVVVHFPRTSVKTMVLAHLEAGKTFMVLGQPQHAKTIWERGLRTSGITAEPSIAADMKARLEALKAKKIK